MLLRTSALFSTPKNHHFYCLAMYVFFRGMFLPRLYYFFLYYWLLVYVQINISILFTKSLFNFIDTNQYLWTRNLKKMLISWDCKKSLKIQPNIADNSNKIFLDLINWFLKRTHTNLVCKNHNFKIYLTFSGLELKAFSSSFVFNSLTWSLLVSCFPKLI
jgi:hypothetical protein